jgi:23S rRNA pseudouridine955/2504/2580 synthase
MNVTHTIIHPSDDGQRLDRWFKKYYAHIPYALVQKMIRTGQVRVDGKRAKMDTRISEGQEVRLPPQVQNEHDPNFEIMPFRISESDRLLLQQAVIYDDGDILALNKPYGWAVQGGSKVGRHLDEMIKIFTDPDGCAPSLIHRLDKDTSGVLLFARRVHTIRALGLQFKNREVKKIYWAITSPAPERNQGTIDIPLSIGYGSLKDRVIDDHENGKRAVTHFSVLERAGRKAAFVAFSPVTGRKHQIRAHAYFAGFPLVNDPKYREDELSMEGDVAVERLHLHAWRLNMTHPHTGQEIQLTADLAPDLMKSWRDLGFDPAAGALLCENGACDFSE